MAGDAKIRKGIWEAKKTLEWLKFGNKRVGIRAWNDSIGVCMDIFHGQFWHGLCKKAFVEIMWNYGTG